MTDRTWYVYLLLCADGSLYCRVRQHNGELSGGARCTRARRPVRLAACAPCADQGTALRLEREIKKLPREKKLAFMRSLVGPPREGAADAQG